MSNAPSKLVCTQSSFTADTKEFEAAALRFKALAHPARIQILSYLTRYNACCCNDLCDCIPLAQSTISQHLKILQQAGFIEWEPKGTSSSYKLVPAMFNEITKTINEICSNATVKSRSDNFEKAD